MKSELNRRNFIKSGMMVTGAIAGGGCASISQKTSSSGRFYKGQFHTHTWWSDGRAAPEQAVSFYKEHGYDFLGITDHNVYATGHRVKKLKKNNVSDVAILDAYKRDFPNSALVKENENGEFEVELKTIAQLREMFEESNKFVLLDGVEGTTRVQNADGVVNQVHMSYLNVPAVPKYFTKCGINATVVQRIAEAYKEVHETAKKMGRDEIFILNHPIWTWYDVLAEDLIANPNVRFFEVCNGGSPYAPGKGLPKNGYDNDIFWDVVNAFRAKRGQPLLYGVGTDDSHHYFGTRDYVPAIHCITQNAWCKVRAEELSQKALVSAMRAGDFAACEGVEPDDFSFNPVTGTLEVSVKGQKNVSRTIEFVVSKKDFSEKPVKTLKVLPPDAAQDKRARFHRTINIYDNKIGKVVKSVTGMIGDPVCASYTMGPDDLYVRARITSPEHPRVRAYQHPKCFMAWTQPYLNTKRTERV
jgi:hypothetical protein